MLLYRRGEIARTSHPLHCLPCPIRGVVQTASIPGQTSPTNRRHHNRRTVMPRPPFGSFDSRHDRTDVPAGISWPQLMPCDLSSGLDLKASSIHWEHFQLQPCCGQAGKLLRAWGYGLSGQGAPVRSSIRSRPELSLLAIRIFQRTTVSRPTLRSPHP